MSTQPEIQNPEFATLEEARTFLRKHFDKGAQCPVCRQFVKRYQRKLNSRMAYALILIYYHFRSVGAGTNHWLDVNKYLLSKDVHSGAANVALLRFWDLLERKPDKKSDGNHSGMYRITDLGIRFVQGECRVPKYIYLYNSRVLKRDLLEVEQISIQQALGDRFNYTELMEGK